MTTINTPPRPCRQRSNVLQSLKGIAAVVVFLGHSLGMLNDKPAIKDTPLGIIIDGQCAVIVFFVMTGFFSYREINMSPTIYLKAVEKKFIRIYPVYFLVTLAGFLLCNSCETWPHQLFSEWGNSFWGNKITLQQLLLHLSLILPFDSTLINPPVWYIVVDMRMTFILPLVIWGVSGKRIVLSIPLILLSIFAPNIGFMQFLAFYLFGVCLKWISIHRDWMHYLSAPCTAIVVGITAVFLLDFFHIIGVAEHKCPHYYKLVQAVGATLLIAVLYQNEEKFTHFKAMKLFGDMSYSFYLIHFILLLALRTFGIGGWEYVSLSFGLSLGCAYVLYKFIEKPVIGIMSAKIQSR